MFDQIQAFHRVSPRTATELAFDAYISIILQSYKVIMLCSIPGFSHLHADSRVPQKGP